MKSIHPPRLVIAGMGGEAGKTMVALAIILGARQRGLEVRAFKKGPDYIDAAWLGWAAGHPARNLDSFLMGFEEAVSSFARHATTAGLNVIEGNRGIFDGSDARGTHSTANLAKRLRAPVVLVLNTAKRTRTAAACVVGCQKLDPEVQLAGVILNPVGGGRHADMLREVIESECGLPVLGAVPRITTGALVPGRHLGLVTPEEYHQLGELRQALHELVIPSLDLDALIRIARAAPPLDKADATSAATPSGAGLRIGYFRDSAFTFYYPENLELLQATGAQLLPLSSLSTRSLPEGIHALYIGGGFPETHAARLSSNQSLLADLRQRAEAGLPIYAECGGLMLLARALHWQGQRYPMAGVFSWEVEMCPRPQGHGYAVLTVEQENPFYPVGITLRGHEFHYSRLLVSGEAPRCACKVERGAGAWAGRDGIVQRNVWASYTHVHALAARQWVEGLIGAARRFAQQQ